MTMNYDHNDYSPWIYLHQRGEGVYIRDEFPYLTVSFSAHIFVGAKQFFLTWLISDGT